MTDTQQPDPFAGLPRVEGFGQAPEVITSRRYMVMPYFGQDVRVTADQNLAEIELVEFLDKATTLDEEDPRAMALIRAFLRTLVHEDDWERFWGLVRQYRQGADDQMKFARHVVETATGHPFDVPSDSSGGPSPTEQSSGVDYSLQERVQHRLEGEGRPDLAMAALQARRGGGGA
jgi:hypothetical protein